MNSIFVGFASGTHTTFSGEDAVIVNNAISQAVTLGETCAVIELRNSKYVFFVNTIEMIKVNHGKDNESEAK